MTTGSVSKRVRGKVDNAALEAVADRLLANKSVNQPLVPDFVERQLYINCLKLVFRLLDAVAATVRLNVCGHDVMIHFEPTGDSSSLRQRAVEKSSALTNIDVAAVAAFARQAGAAPSSKTPGSSMSFLNIVEPAKRELVTQLHATLYALVLGILDDLLTGKLADSESFAIV